MQASEFWLLLGHPVRVVPAQQYGAAHTSWHIFIDRQGTRVVATVYRLNSLAGSPLESLISIQANWLNLEHFRSHIGSNGPRPENAKVGRSCRSHLGLYLPVP